MANVTLYSSRYCGYCHGAEAYLRRKGVDNIDKIMVDQVPGAIDEMIARSGRRTVPQIFIGNVHVGGYDDLLRLDRAGGLDPLLQHAEQPPET